jgi:hypothetical protein
MDFVSDALFDGRRLRALTMANAFTGETLAIDIDRGNKSKQAVAAMTRIAFIRGAPRTINGCLPATSASTPTGSYSWQTPAPRSEPGGGTTTTAVLAHRLAG